MSALAGCARPAARLGAGITLGPFVDTIHDDRDPFLTYTTTAGGWFRANNGSFYNGTLTGHSLDTQGTAYVDFDIVLGGGRTEGFDVWCILERADDVVVLLVDGVEQARQTGTVYGINFSLRCGATGLASYPRRYHIQLAHLTTPNYGTPGTFYLDYVRTYSTAS